MKIINIILIATIGITLVSCNQIKLESTWADEEISIDGELGEWQNNMIVTKNSNIGVGFANDNDNMYIALVAIDRNSIMQVLSNGFTVWIDSKGGKSKHFGVRFPIGHNKNEMMGLLQKRNQNAQDYDFIIQGLLTGQYEIEIIGPGKNQIARFDLNNSTGIDVVAAYKNGEFTYEIKIPLQNTSENLYSINVESGATIGVGFTTPEIDPGTMKGSPSGGSMGGHSGGGMGKGRGGGQGQGGRMGGQSGGAKRQRPNPINYWAKLTLINQQ